LVQRTEHLRSEHALLKESLEKRDLELKNARAEAESTIETLQLQLRQKTALIDTLREKVDSYKKDNISPNPNFNSSSRHDYGIPEDSQVGDEIQFPKKKNSAEIKNIVSK